MSTSHADPAPLDESADQDSKLRPYSPSERKIRAAAFAARVHSLKYYIGLIVAKSII
ncbi:MAG TPA: hypothetical protein VLA46_05190 [Saprospiraceae bacterium]|nr:hypothetical protein [Saprospiraceae bacterium]